MGRLPKRKVPGREVGIEDLFTLTINSCRARDSKRHHFALMCKKGYDHCVKSTELVGSLSCP
jgi:hypothetical protein